MSQTLGGRILWARERRGLEQAVLGRALGQRDGTTISKWEHDERRPSADALVAVVRALEVNAHWLLTGEGEPWALPGEADRVLARVRALVTARSPSSRADDVEEAADDRDDATDRTRGPGSRGVGGA